jgi:uncharacterized protein
MTVCLDTNVLVRIFGTRQPFRPLLRALLDGRLTLAISTEILLEYEEVVTALTGNERWREVARLLNLLDALHGNLRRVEPSYRFKVIASDPEDDKFCDCAITAEADYVITEDRHFAPLATAGYRPQPIEPEEFIRRHLSATP